MNDALLLLVSTLHQARHLEDAALLTLRAMLEVAVQALGQSSHSASGEIIRGVIHLRPLDGYRQLLVLEADEAQLGTRIQGERALLPSTTAWRWVSERGCAVSIDVNLAQLRPHLPGAVAQIEQSLVTFDSTDSQLRFLSRQASHVHVVPLRAPGGAVDGMISIEATCPAAMGQPFIWESCARTLELLAAVAAPYLLTLTPIPTCSPEADDFMPVIGRSMAGLMKVLSVFAQQEETILICGPTGTGKSRLARWVHERSARRKGPFEGLDLTTVPEELQLAELSGWRRGAFTSASRDNPGCIARAERGTLFIDEIDKLSMRAQAGLLLMLDKRSYRVLGDGAGERQANVRIIVGTNANLQAAVRAGTFREDLFYRINVLPVNLPPLADRADEVPAWANYMVQRRHRETCVDGQARLQVEAERLLISQSWPGNLRQLDNIVRRAYTLALVEHGVSPQGVVVHRRHVERALAYEQGGGVRLLPDLLSLAASAFVSEAEQRMIDGSPLELELTEAFRGFVLATAIERHGRDEAFYLFGKDVVVRQRNQSKAFRRDLERVEDLYRALGQEGGSLFRCLLEQVRDE